MPGTDDPSLGRDGDESCPAQELDGQAGDLHIEVSNLRRSPYDNMASVPWYRQRVQVPRLVVATALAVMLVLLLLVATPVGSALLALVPRPTPTPATARLVFPPVTPATATPSPYPIPSLIAPATGPIPANCTPGTPLVDFAPDTVSPGVGGSDVWLVAFFGAGA